MKIEEKYTVNWNVKNPINIHVIHHRENFLITAENVFDAINDARKVYEQGDLLTYNVVITSVYSEPLEDWEEEND